MSGEGSPGWFRAKGTMLMMDAPRLTISNTATGMGMKTGRWEHCGVAPVGTRALGSSQGGLRVSLAVFLHVVLVVPSVRSSPGCARRQVPLTLRVRCALADFVKISCGFRQKLCQQKKCKDSKSLKASCGDAWQKKASIVGNVLGVESMELEFELALRDCLLTGQVKLEGKWSDDMFKAWRRQICAVGSWNVVQGPAGAVCELRDAGVQWPAWDTWCQQEKKSLLFVAEVDDIARGPFRRCVTLPGLVRHDVLQRAVDDLAVKRGGRLLLDAALEAVEDRHVA